MLCNILKISAQLKVGMESCYNERTLHIQIIWTSLECERLEVKSCPVCQRTQVQTGYGSYTVQRYGSIAKCTFA